MSSLLKGEILFTIQFSALQDNRNSRKFQGYYIIAIMNWYWFIATVVYGDRIFV